MILGDADIRAAIERNDVVIAPYNRGNLGPVSYDVCLGEYYYTEQQTWGDRLNPYSEVQVREAWGPVQRASTVLRSFEGFNEGDRLIELHPGETILAHTVEFIGGRNNITTRMQARSTWGRLGVGVCKCAGKGDPGYINRWTMEITSFNRHHTVFMKVGERIAQIEFMYVAHNHMQYETKGNYMESDPADLEATVNAWVPEMMLPKLYRQKKHGEVTGTAEDTAAR